jgi:hypothetical protein
MSSQLRVSRTLLALGVGLALTSGAALAQEKAAAKVQLPQQVLPTGAEDAVAAPAAAARSLARSAAPTQEELIQQLVKMTSESGEGLAVEKRANGVEAVNLEGQFMSVAIATPAANGGYVLGCATGEDAVAHAKHAQAVEAGKEPKVLLRPTAKQQPVLEEK